MDLQSRVRRRVEELGQSPITLAKAVGLERGFINDIVIGRKHSVRTDKLELVARALGVSIGYLQGTEVAPRGKPNMPMNTIAAICETVVWRTLEASVLPPAPPIRKLMPGHYDLYLARGDGMHGAGVNDGMTMIGIEHDRFLSEHGVIPTGAIVVSTRTHEETGAVETSLRKIVHGHQTRLIACPPAGRHYDDLVVEKPEPGIALKIISVIAMSVTFLIADIDIAGLI
jgi:transcriptional regulator with XRE-family HTH domain